MNDQGRRLKCLRTSPDASHTHLFVALFVILPAMTYPVLVSVDGFQFLNSARSLFGPDFHDRYASFREPGYPILVRLVHGLFGSSDVWITLSQSIALSVAVILLSRALGFGLRSLKQLVFGVITIVCSANPIFVGYASTIFRQSFLCLAVATLVWGVHTATHAASSRDLWRASVVFVIGVLFGGAISTMVFYLAIIPGLIILFSFYRNDSNEARKRPSVKSLLAAFATVICLVSLVWVSWNRLVDSSNKPANTSQTNFTVSDAISDAFDLGPVAFGRQFVTMARATLMLGPTDNMNGIVENELWSRWQLDPNNRCGAWDGIPPEEAAYAKAFLTSSCRSAVGQKLMRALRTPGLHLYRLASIALLVCPLYLLIRRRWRELMVLATPLWFLVLHASRDYSNDRYGVPLYPAGIACLAYLFVELLGAVNQRFSSRRNSFQVA